MADIVDKATRSRMMAGIRGRNTAPELVLRKEMHARGFRFRLHRRDLPARPDLVFPKYRAVVLVHGCFWHSCPHCQRYTPKHNRAWWRDKLNANRSRDERKAKELKRAGWKVITVWECRLKRSPSREAGRVVRMLDRRIGQGRTLSIVLDV